MLQMSSYRPAVSEMKLVNLLASVIRIETTWLTEQLEERETDLGSQFQRVHFYVSVEEQGRVCCSPHNQQVRVNKEQNQVYNFTDKPYLSV